MSSFGPKKTTNFLKGFCERLGQKTLKQFIGFKVETMTPKNPFELNWPLRDKNNNKIYIIFRLLSQEWHIKFLARKKDLYQDQNNLVWFKLFWTESKPTFQYWILSFDPCPKCFNQVQNTWPVQNSFWIYRKVWQKFKILANWYFLLESFVKVKVWPSWVGKSLTWITN